MNEQFISPYKIKKKYDITSNTLRTWAENDKIRYIRIRDGKGKRMYNLQDVEKIFEGTNTTLSDKRKVVCYARVSSDHQKEDLDRQIKLLQKEYPEAEVISDIGSGLNWSRKGFKTLLERVHEGSISKVVVTYNDRMCRFGLELIEWIFKKSNTEFVVLNKTSGGEHESSELAEDMLSITTVFVARNNGIRSAKYRKQRIQEKKQEKEKEKEKSKI